MSESASPAGPKSGKKFGAGQFTGRKDPRNGRGPKKGAPNAGRPSKAYVEWCVKVLSDQKVEGAVMAILRSGKHKHFASMYRTISERAHGKPVQPISGPDGKDLIPGAITVRLVKPA